jgi:hypothetical protein
MGIFEDFWGSYVERSFSPGTQPKQQSGAIGAGAAPPQQQQQVQPVQQQQQPVGAGAAPPQQVYNPTESMVTYPFYEYTQGAVNWWDQNVVMNPAFQSVLQAAPLHPITKSFITGAVEAPTKWMLQPAGMIVPGSERLIRETIRDPTSPITYASAGVPLLITSMVQEAQKDPARFAGGLVFSTLLLGGASRISTKITGAIRTRGMTEIPIERIGYAPEYGYPISYRQTVGSLTKSFEKGTLLPKPSKMSLSGKVPYVPTEARLPTDIPGMKVMWTGWESTPVGRIGGKFILEKGASEIPGMYGAPVAESYFTKTGGQMPRILGFDFKLIRKPSLVHTEVIDLVSGKLPKKGGVGYLPMTKPEYEAVIPMGNILEITGKRYYTKVGGIGESHFMGTRIPIIETKVTGLMETAGAVTKIPKIAYESYRGTPLINLGYSGPLLAGSIRKAPSQPIYSKSSMASSRGISSGSKSVLPSSKTYAPSQSGISYSPSSIFSSKTPSYKTPSYTIRGSSLSPPTRGSSITPPSYTYLFSPPSYPPSRPPSYGPPSYPPSYPPYRPPYYPPSRPPSPPVIPPIRLTGKSVLWWPEQKKRPYKPRYTAKSTAWKLKNPVPRFFMQESFNPFGKKRKR